MTAESPSVKLLSESECDLGSYQNGFGSNNPYRSKYGRESQAKLQRVKKEQVVVI